jgi:hypothetical protein
MLSAYLSSYICKECQTFRIHIPFQNPENYSQRSEELYAWKEKWQARITNAFVSNIGKYAGRKVKYLVLETNRQAVADLPEGIRYERIPALAPVWGVAADIPDNTFTFTTDKNWLLISGTNQFSAGQKVYPFPRDSTYYKMINVCGKHKQSGRYITILQPIRRLLNWRAESITNPIVIFHMRYQNGWIESNDVGYKLAKAFADEMDQFVRESGPPKPKGVD